MNNNRLIKTNQFEDFLYVGDEKKGTYKNWGDYAEDLMEDLKNAK